jgi:hypothetical protein
VVAGAAAVGVALVALVILRAIAPPPSGGPYAGLDAYDVRVPVPAGGVVTWGSVLPPNWTTEAVAIEAVEPVNVRGLEVLGIVMSDPAVPPSIGVVDGFSPPAIHAQPVAGTVIPPHTANGIDRQVLVGVRRTDGGTAAIDGLRVRYRHGGDRFEDVLPYTLQLVDGPG